MVSNIDKVFYINLSHRDDKNKNTLRELLNMGFTENQIERFDAIGHPFGPAGCTMSHISCLRSAIERGYNYIFICEDDIKFFDPEFTKKNLERFFNESMKFDVLLIGLSGHKKDIINDYCAKVIYSHSAIGYIVNGNYLKTLLHNFEEGLRYLLLTHQDWNYAVDVYWHQLQKKDTFLCFYPRKVGHYPGFSDISRVDTNNNDCLIDD